MSVSDINTRNIVGIDQDGHGIVTALERTRSGRTVARLRRDSEAPAPFVTTSPALWVVVDGDSLVNQAGVEVAEGHSHPAAGRTLPELSGRLPEGWRVTAPEGAEYLTEAVAIGPDGVARKVIPVHPQIVASTCIANARALRALKGA